MVDVGVRRARMSTRPDAAVDSIAVPPIGPRRWPSLVSLAAFAVILGITVALSVTVAVLNDSNENRLLQLQTRQSAALVGTYVQDLATPLASAAEIAAGTGGDSVAYRRYAAGFLTAQTHFVSLSLWSVTAGDGARLVSVVGGPPRLGTAGPAATAFIAKAATAGTVAINTSLTATSAVFGYAYGSHEAPTRFVVYAEDGLRERLEAKVTRTSAFHGLRFAMYLGRGTSPAQLLLTSEKTSTVHGRTSTMVVPLGTTQLTLVVGTRAPLGGRLADQRWWIVLVLGTAVALGGGLLTDRLVKRRRRAESLTAEIDALLRDQKGIAETLQQALVPEGLPAIDGLELAARYLPGVNGVDIGGDWYDVVPLPDGRVFFAVGDVSGRGLEAGSVMAALHFAIRAYALEGHDPATVLDLLGGLLTMARDRHFATVVCGLLDVTTGALTVANAGHLPMLVVDGSRSHFLQVPAGPPIGVRRGHRYEAAQLQLPAGATLLAYTDGLVERRGETLDVSLDRLRDAASPTEGPVEDLLAGLLAELRPDGSADDTALLGLRPQPVPVGTALA